MSIDETLFFAVALHDHAGLNNLGKGVEIQ